MNTLTDTELESLKRMQMEATENRQMTGVVNLGDILDRLALLEKYVFADQERKND